MSAIPDTTPVKLLVPEGGSTRIPRTRIEFPDTVHTLGDLIEKNNGTSQFDYVVVRPSSDTNKKRTLYNLLSFMDPDVTHEMTVNKIPSFVLTTDKVEFPLSSAINRYIGSFRKRPENWINVSNIVIVYYGAGSMLTDASTVQFSIEDKRLKKRVSAVKAAVNSNGTSAFCLYLDFSVFRSDIGDLILKVENTNPIFQEGKAWGSMTVQMSLRFAHNAVSYGLDESTGMTSMDATILKTRRTNPSVVNLTYNDNDVKSLREMHKQKLLPVLHGLMGESLGNDDAGTSASFTPEEIRERLGLTSDQFVEPLQLGKYSRFDDRIHDIGKSSERPPPSKGALKNSDEKHPKADKGKAKMLEPIEEDQGSVYSAVSASALETVPDVPDLSFLDAALNY